MDIYFLRHANAGQSLADPKQDEKRPLDQLGVDQSQQMGRVLKALNLELDAIVSSPLARTKQTAALVAEELGFKKSLLLDDALRPDAKFEDFRQLVRRHAKDNAIMVVGHNPTLSEFLSLMVSEEATDSTIEMKKAAVAKVQMERRQPTLQWILTPKTVEAAQEASASKSRPKTSRK
ncbi:MAG: phosphohistidine phosphatase SixA [Terriglobales bacterium]